MHHLAIFQGTVNASSLTQVNAISDPAIAINNNKYMPPRQSEVYWAFASGATLTKAVITTPRFNGIFSPNIRPIQQSSTVISSDPGYMSLHKTPLILRGNEELSVQVVNGASEATYVGIEFGDSIEPVTSPEVFCLRGTDGSTTSTANALSTLSITWDNTLPSDTKWRVVGMEVVGANTIFARLILTGQEYRPGCLGTASIEKRSPRYVTELQSYGYWSIPFISQQMPRIEVFDSSAISSHTVFLYIVRA